MGASMTSAAPIVSVAAGPVWSRVTQVLRAELGDDALTAA